MPIDQRWYTIFMSISKNEDSEITFKPNELREIILSVLGATLVIGGTIAFPTLPIVLGSIIKLVKEFKDVKISEKKVKRVLKNLEKKQILSLLTEGDQVYVEIKDKYNISILKYSIKQLLDLRKRKKKWNGKWYMVVFDVPEEQRKKRIYLRRFLTQVGFYPYQKSVYVYPYECEKEIQLIKTIVESSKYMSYIIADKIENEKQAKIFFGL